MTSKNFARRLRLGSTFKIAARALRRNKLRSALTALGVIIGVGSLIALLGVGNGARAEVEAHVASLGQNVIQISPGSITKSAVKLGLGSSGALTERCGSVTAKPVTLP